MYFQNVPLIFFVSFLFEGSTYVPGEPKNGGKVSKFFTLFENIEFNSNPDSFLNFTK